MLEDMHDPARLRLLEVELPRADQWLPRLFRRHRTDGRVGQDPREQAAAVRADRVPGLALLGGHGKGGHDGLLAARPEQPDDAAAVQVVDAVAADLRLRIPLTGSMSPSLGHDAGARDRGYRQADGAGTVRQPVSSSSMIWWGRPVCPVKPLPSIGWKPNRS